MLLGENRKQTVTVSPALRRSLLSPVPPPPKNVHNFPLSARTHTCARSPRSSNNLSSKKKNLTRITYLEICFVCRMWWRNGNEQLFKMAPTKKKKKRKRENEGKPHLHGPINPKHSEESQVIYNITESIIKIHWQSRSVRHRVNAQFNEGWWNV